MGNLFKHSSILNSRGSTMLILVGLLALLAGGAFLVSGLSDNQVKTDLNKLFYFLTLNAQIQAQAILSQPEACAASFQGVNLPVPGTPSTPGTPARSKLPNNEISPVLLPNQKGPPPLLVGSSYQDRRVQLQDMAIHARTVGGVTRYYYELVFDKINGITASVGGTRSFKRDFEMIVIPSTTAPGTIEGCSSLSSEDVPWDEICQSVNSKYDPGVGGCATCASPNETIVGWTGPGAISPICKGVDQQICEQIGTERAYWNPTAKSCFICKNAFERLRQPASAGNLHCDDHIDVASFENAAKQPCPAGMAYRMIAVNGIFKVQCQ